MHAVQKRVKRKRQGEEEELWNYLKNKKEARRTPSLRNKGEGQQNERVGATERQNTLAANLPVAWRCRHADPKLMLRRSHPTVGPQHILRNF